MPDEIRNPNKEIIDEMNVVKSLTTTDLDAAGAMLLPEEADKFISYTFDLASAMKVVRQEKMDRLVKKYNKIAVTGIVRHISGFICVFHFSPYEFFERFIINRLCRFSGSATIQKAGQQGNCPHLSEIPYAPHGVKPFAFLNLLR